MSEYTVWWIDDNPDREGTAEQMEEFVSELSVLFLEPNTAVANMEESDDLGEIDIVLIDWKLNEHGDFLGKGLTMAGKVREEFPSIPIYGFSNAVEELRTKGTKEQFEATFDASEFASEEGAINLKLDLDSYAEIEQTRGEGFESLLGVLDPPDGALEDLRSVVPRRYMDGLKVDPRTDGGSVIEFADWVQNRLLVTPGPLWNDDWTATKLGLQRGVIDKYDHVLEEATDSDPTYSGVFAHRSSEGRLWWTTLIIDAVVSIAQEKDTRINELTTVARTVFEEPERVSECAVCHEERPDILAAGRDGENATTPVHLACSHIHHTREGAFEDYRVADEL